MKLQKLTLREIHLKLVSPFQTSFGISDLRRILLVEVEADGVTGWGESTAGENPFYNEEWTESAWLIARDYVAPRVLKHNFESADEVTDRTAHIRGHRMARGGVEVAVWDFNARRNGVPLAKEIGGNFGTKNKGLQGYLSRPVQVREK